MSFVSLLVVVVKLFLFAGGLEHDKYILLHREAAAVKKVCMADVSRLRSSFLIVCVCVCA